MTDTLILASKSAARKALLTNAGLAFTLADPCINERAIAQNHMGPQKIALALAGAKANAISKQEPHAVVIGADQTLALGTTLLHKPVDLPDASRQLDALNGKTHKLYSAVALARNGKLLWHSCSRASLTMHRFSDTERDAVLALEGQAVLGSVGGYRLEGASIRLFKTISGSYFTILGLPLLPLLKALRTHAPSLFSPNPPSTR